ncbi:hypothetical protein HF673_05145 [Acidithiobacillus thiooxidans]|jgi:hypothetical protein|nr:MULTISPECIES: hypothetical protein [Acidithiobacillus]MBU2835186.1 hypothetical protein [Acidithiobacillus thiooxidans]
MPIKECTPHGGKEYQWGDHGTCYADRKEAMNLIHYVSVAALTMRSQ